jgi:putative transposase
MPGIRLNRYRVSGLVFSPRYFDIEIVRCEFGRGPKSATAVYVIDFKRALRIGEVHPGGGFFQRCLAKNRGSTPAQQRLWRDGIYDQIREVMSLQGSLSIERMCQMVPVSRRGFYRSLKEQQPAEEEMEVRSAIQQIALEHRRRYGYRRITAELHRQGMPVNHKRVARIMREDNLLGMQPKQFVVTTNSNHKLEIYLNLAGRMKVTGINQLWVADITYIRLKAEFVYLAVILDGLSRKVVGWALDRTLATRLTIGALEQAIATRQPEPGLVHHSDRGLQYASEEYVKVLENNRVIPSMSRPANPYDNASCESFMKTLWSGRKSTPTTTTTWNICEQISKSSSSSITIGCACTRRWAIDLPKSSSNRSRRQVRPNREAQRWCSLRTKRTAWGKGLKCRPLPQTPSPARRCKNAFRKAEAVSK